MVIALNRLGIWVKMQKSVRWKYKIGSRIMLIIISCSVLTTGFTGAISILQGVKTIENEANEKLTYIALSHANEFSKELEKTECIVNSLVAAVAADFDLQEFNSDSNCIIEKTNLYKQLVSNFAHMEHYCHGAFISFDPSKTEIFYSIWYSDIHGDGKLVYMTRGIIEKILYGREVEVEAEEEFYLPTQELNRESPELQYLFLTLDEGGPLWFDPYKEIWFDALLTSYVTPIIVDDAIIGVAGMDITIEHIKNTISNISVYDSGFAVLMDGRGEILLQPDGVVIDETMYSGCAALSNGWVLGLFVPRAELFAPIHTLAITIAVFMVIIILAGIVISYLSSRKVSFAIDNAIEQLRYIEIGDFTREMPKELLESNDDLGHFIKSVNTIQGVIRDLMSEIRMTGGQLLTNPIWLSTAIQEAEAATENALWQLESMGSAHKKIILDELQRSRQKDAVVIYQSRLAQMGEMVEYIAHQWKQPLNSLYVILNELKDAHAYGELNNEALNGAVDQASNVITRMSQTIEDFMNYLSPAKEKRVFLVADSINFALSITSHAMPDEFSKEIIVDDNAAVYGFENEFTQVLCNLLDNAKDAFLSTRTKPKLIKIVVTQADENVQIEIFNTANHMSADVMENIFKPFYTTKPRGQGSGLGLYMTKVIIEEHMNGKIRMENFAGGVKCCILLPSAKI